MKKEQSRENSGENRQSRGEERDVTKSQTIHTGEKRKRRQSPEQKERSPVRQKKQSVETGQRIERRPMSGDTAGKPVKMASTENVSGQKNETVRKKVPRGKKTGERTADVPKQIKRKGKPAGAPERAGQGKKERQVRRNIQSKGTKSGKGKESQSPPSAMRKEQAGAAGVQKEKSKLSTLQKTWWERLETAGKQFSKKSKKINKKRVRMTILWIMEIITACLFAFGLVLFYGQRVSNAGDSMSPVLKNGDVVLVDRVIYNAMKPKRGDVIVFKPGGNENAHYMIKRVVALPGETIQIRDGAVYIDGKECTEGIYTSDILSPGVAEEPLELGENEYFVIGDNHAGSDDSRMADVGNVKREDIFGKAWFIVNFGEDFGFIKSGT